MTRAFFALRTAIQLTACAGVVALAWAAFMIGA